MKRLVQYPEFKHLAVAVVVASLVLFGDTLLPLVGHALHILIEVVELACEHLLEWAFGLSRRAAQAVTFWTGFALMAYFAARWIRWICRTMRRLCVNCFYLIRVRWHRFWAHDLHQPAMRITLTVGAFSALVYVFS